MPSRKAIKRRIGSVGTTRQIVKAMNMVAATKLSKLKLRWREAKPQFDEFRRIIDQLKACERAQEHVFFKEREQRRRAYVLISSDKGYCGSYNSSVAQAALAHMDTGEGEVIIAIGQRGREFLQRRGKEMLRAYRDVSEKVVYEDVKNIGDFLIGLYLRAEVDEVYVVYTRFETVLSHVPEVVRILPAGGGPTADSAAEPMKYEPDIDRVIEHAIPQYVSTFLYGVMLESGTCEQSARMVSMDAATKNASEIIEDLTRLYNRKRQAHITQEITEIIGGANVSE